MASEKNSISLSIHETPREKRLRTWVQMVRTFYVIQRRLVSLLGENEVTLPQFDLLATLRFNEGATQQELADRLLVTKGNVCGVLDRLEDMGWVERRADPKDGRANRLYLTVSGRRKIDALLPEHDEFILRVMRPISDADAAAIRTVMEVMERSSEESA